MLAYCTNYFLTAGVIGAREFGRASTVHIFGAAFGVGLAWTLSFLRTSTELLKEHVCVECVECVKIANVCVSWW